MQRNIWSEKVKRVDDKQYRPIDNEERELIRSIDNDEWVESRDTTKKKKLARSVISKKIF